MKKRLLIIFTALTLTLCCFAACNNVQKSSDASIVLISISKVEVQNNSVTLTTAQYNLLKTNPKSNIEYTLADNASVEINVTTENIKLTVTAQDGTQKEYNITLTVLSNDTALSVSKVSGVAVKDNCVTLTTAQYNLLKANAQENIEYTLAENASVEINVTTENIKLTVTAQDGTQKEYNITLTVLSDDTALSVSKISGVAVKDNSVTLTTAQYNLLKANPKSNIEYTLAENASVEIDVTSENIKLTVTAQDGTQKEYNITLKVLSDDTALSVSKVSGVAVKDNCVTLTTAQYNLLKANPQENTEYTLAENASVEIDVTSENIKLTVTAQDGTQKEYNITLKVLSDDTALSVSKVSGVAVKDNCVTLTTAQYNLLKANPQENTEYTLAENASVEIDVTTENIKLTVTAQDGTQKEYDITLTVLSDDMALSVSKVSGIAVKDNSVTLTTAQYNLLKANAQENIEYTLAENASVEINVTSENIKLTVTAQDGTQKEYNITLTVLSNLADITVTDIYGIQVQNSMITVTEKQYAVIKASDELKENCNYTLSEKATLSVTYEADLCAIVFRSLSEDKTENRIVTVWLNVAIPFGQHTLTGSGSAENVSFDYDKDVYLLAGTAAVKDFDGNSLYGTSAFSVNVTPIALGQGKEVVLSAVYANNMQIRFALRGIDETHFLIFSDYKDGTSFLNYTEHVASVEFAEGDKINMGLIVKGNSAVMTMDGVTVFRRTLPRLRDTEIVVNTYNCLAELSDLVIITDSAAAEELYDNALIGWRDKMTGITLINTSENRDRFVENDDGTIYVGGASSNARVMGALYMEGVPVGGVEYAVSGHIRVTDTKTTGTAASKVELQICKNLQNFVKLQLFRFPTNNSFKAYATLNGVGKPEVTCENNTMPKGTEYEMDFVFIYDCGKLSVYLKDGVYMPQYKLVYTLETDWGYTMFLIAMRQYCNVTFGNFKTYYEDDFDRLKESLGDTGAGGITLTEIGGNGTAFVAGVAGSFEKIGTDYVRATVNKDGREVSGEYWMISGNIQFGEYKAWTQGDVCAYVDATHGVRYVFEYTGSYYQVFTEIRNGTSTWGGYTIIKRPQNANPSLMKFNLINYGGKTSLLIDGYVYHTYENDMLREAKAATGGKGGTMRITGLKAETDEDTVKNFAANMKEYSYVSPYESRIASLYEQYKNAEKGGVLIMGSSTMDYWSDWKTDIGGRNGYNVGIGGTIVEDWTYAYDRLVKPFNPSVVLLFLGGNNVNAMGHSGDYTSALLEELLKKMHEDFPTAEIYYIYSLPVPNNYKNGEYTPQYGKLIANMKTVVANTSWLNGIDMADELTSGGNPIAEFFRSDGIHLTDAGYDVFAEIIQREVFGQ